MIYMSHVFLPPQDDIYDGVIGPNDEPLSGSDEEGEGDDSDADNAPKKGGKGGKKDKKKRQSGDFKRKPGAVGLILQDDLVELGELSC